MRLLANLLVLALALPAMAVQIVTENPNPACEELHLAKALKLYKDPTLFLSAVTTADTEPDAFGDSPLLTSLKGTVQLMRLGPPHEFRNFGAIAKVYELAEPKLRGVTARKNEKDERVIASPLIVPVKVCGDNQPYSDTLGFVLLSDLRDAQVEDYEPGSLPPSTYPNPIPSLRSDKAPTTGKN
jgi:hypothetical protein